MSDSISIECPHCTAKLKLKTKGQTIDGRSLVCPKCADSFTVQGSTVEAPTQLNPKRSRRPPDVESVSTGDVDVPYDDAPYEDDAADDDYGEFDDECDDEYDVPSPKPKRKGRSITKRKSAASRSGSGHRDRGFGGRVGFGFAAGLVAAALTTALGWSGSTVVVSVGAILIGAAVGGGVWYATAKPDGGTGMFAASLAIVCMLVGKMGAFYVAPQMSMISQIALKDRGEILTPAETLAKIAEESNEDGMIQSFAADVNVDQQWLDDNAITNEMQQQHWETTTEDSEYSAQYLPQVWAEATKRWNAKSPDEKRQLIAQYQKQLRAEYGVMTESEVNEAVREATSDAEMVYTFSWEVENDEDWLLANGITDEQLDAFSETVTDDAPAPDRCLPAVWQEATRRWTALSDDDRRQLIDEIAVSVREQSTFSAEDAELEKSVVGVFTFILVLIAAVLNSFSPISSLICTVLGIIAAFALGAGVVTRG